MASKRGTWDDSESNLLFLVNERPLAEARSLVDGRSFS